MLQTSLKRKIEP